MRSSNVIYLDPYRVRKDARFRRTQALVGHEPERSRLLPHLWRALSLVGGDRGAVVWLDEYGPGLAHAYSLLDLASDRPRRLFSPIPLREAWEVGVPGLLDMADFQAPPGHGRDDVRSACAVALGSDGPRSWFMILDSITPRPPLSARVTGDLMFIAGELSSMVLHRDLGATQGARTTRKAAAGGPGGTLEEPFAGWPVLQDIEGRRRDEEASRRIATRFLVARVVRGLVEDDFVMDPDSLGYQVNGVRDELDALEREDPERRIWERVLASIELLNQDELLAATLEWGGLVEDHGHLNGAREIHALAYELAVAAGAVEAAVDAARFRGRVLRKLARWDEAVSWYDIARTVAEEVGDTRKLARVLDGLGNTYRDKGNLPQARDVLHQVMTLGRKTGDRYVRAIAHHDLMTVEKLAGDLDDAVLHGWEAVQAYDSPEGGLRALFDLAGVLRESGELSAAWDAYSVVAGQVEGSEYYLLALDAMAYISALRGQVKEHELLRDRLEEEGWEEASPVYRAQMFFYRGLSCRTLGREEEAVGWLKRALAFAEVHALNKLIFDAEDALEQGPPVESELVVDSRLRDPTGKGILGVRRGLRELRATLVGTAVPF